ncbi:MAG: hypothetical protein IPP77_08240 [Bacteroidetes bacterium]|nr:hypothetical protein [Bacteroidota bacterium]
MNARDRQYPIWKRNSLSIDLFTEKVFLQKPDYIHDNPVQEKWGLSIFPEDYKYSSASFYYHGKDDFGFLKDFRGE